MDRVSSLAERLRRLRLEGRSSRLTQTALAGAMGVSVPLISAWEHGIVPPPERLDDYARLFAVTEGRLRLKSLQDMDDSERTRYEQSYLALFALRDQIADPGGDRDVHNPLQFPPGEAITIVCSELPARLRTQSGYASPEDPDFVASYKYADLDALIELLLAITSLNPTSPIKRGIPRELSIDDLTAHLIALGGVDFNEVTAAAMSDLSQVPVAQTERVTDDDTGAFSVGFPDGARRELKPVTVRTGRQVTLKEDVAHFLRAPNPYNRRRTLTCFNGMYSRGSYGVVRALTDLQIRSRNAAYIADRFRDADIYSIVSRVKIIGNEVVPPDWTAEDIRLHEWPEEGA